MATEAEIPAKTPPEAIDDNEPVKAAPGGGLSWVTIFGCIFGGLVGFVCFLVGLNLMINSFKAMAGTGASTLFTAVQDPIAGLMVGVLATVLVQSSSTTTSMVVAMVAADALNVRNAIPIVMGANIGTSATNTIVSMSQSGNRVDLERSFAGATVHDLFNFLTVLTLLPLEWIVSLVDGTGGPLYWFTFEITEAMLQGQKSSALFKSPIKKATGPIAELFLKSDKYVIYAQTLERPEALIPESVCDGACKSVVVPGVNCSQQSFDVVADCSEYACVDSTLAGYYKKIDKKAYADLVKCEDVFPAASLCGEDSCYLGGSAYYDEKVANGRVISKGILKGAGDTTGGILGVLIALFFMSLGLIMLCKCLQTIFLGHARKVIRYSASLNGYAAIIVGFGTTIVVQSSSVVTSSLVPLCGIGVLPLKKMLPMTLGSNIGTTATALIAACVDMKPRGLQIALAHFFFNLIGILIWFPAPPMRRIPLTAAKLLGMYASYFRFVPLLYILFAFFVVPGIFLAVALAFYSSVAVGVVLLLVILLAGGVFELWWWRGFGKGPGAFLVLSEEARKAGRKQLVEKQAALMGMSEDEYERHENHLTWFGN